MPRRSSRTAGTAGTDGGSGGKNRRWRSISRSRSRSRGRKQQQQQQQSPPPDYPESGDYAAASHGGRMARSDLAEETGEFAYVTSPPTNKAGLTGNISSLFRTAFKHKRSSERQMAGSSHEDYLEQQQQGYTPPNTSGYDPNQNGLQLLGSSASVSSQQRTSRLGFGGTSNNASVSKHPNTSGGDAYPNSGGDGGGIDAGGSYSVSASRSVASRTSSRLFYSNADDDSEDSFDEQSRSNKGRASTPNTYGYQTESTGPYASGEESFITEEDETNGSLSQSSRRHRKGRRNKDYDDDNDIPSTTILRYRGFSTSIKNLFLDEALVCASMGCFGLILSNRTEFLLQLRNDRRGVQWGRTSSRKTLPSRIVAYALLLTLLLIGFTFVVWGFGSNNSDKSDPFSFNNGSHNSNGNSNRNSNRNSNSNSNGANYDVDDAVNQNQNDNNYMNDDGGNDNANDDANYNNYNVNDDGGNNNANDDANYNYNYNYNYNDDGGNNEAADDDGNAAVNDDGGNNYYGGNNDDYYNDDYNNKNDDAYGGRQLGRSAVGGRTQQQHCVNGIFKIRDMKESLWEPAIDFLGDEWYRPDETPSDVLPRGLQNYDDDYSSRSPKRDMASDLRISLIFAFLIVLGILGRRRRMRTRYYIVRARAQEDHLFYASSGTGTKRVGFQDSREDQYEGACSHTLCGCYPTDPPRDGDEIEDEVQVNDDGVSQRKKKPHNEDCVGRGFNCLLGMCCGVVCKCWFQCLSICALAQEAREMRLLVPTRFQRVDYITHQPFHEYQKEVNDLRKGWMGKTRRKSGLMPHFKALSRLSRYILVLSISLSVIIAATLFFNPRASFSWPDVIILSATFLQSFLVIWIVHWIFHKSDLSLDAVIKFFAAGFVIAVPAAFFFEGLLVNMTLSTAYFGYGLGQVLGGDAFVEWVSQQYRLLWILVEIFNAYIVATVTEELCKYYTFRCVEHPDLIFLTGLVSTTQDERALEGGVVKYPFSSHQVQKTNAKNPYDDDASHYSRSSHRSKGSSKNSGFDPDEEEFEEDDHDVRTHRQKAAAVTTAMISVAVGLACAENFLYVFLLGGTGASYDDSESGMDGYLQEWIVLFFRSIFPVHALAAAMQSVNMVRKFVEAQDVNGHRIGVGRIILPAVIMHGTFDAILLGINVYIESSWDEYLEANGGNIDDQNGTPYSPFFVNVVAWLSITVVMLAGFLWYFKENRRQRLRLIELEEQERANQAGTPGYASPAPHITEVELV